MEVVIANPAASHNMVRIKHLILGTNDSGPSNSLQGEASGEENLDSSSH